MEKIWNILLSTCIMGCPSKWMTDVHVNLMHSPNPYVMVQGANKTKKYRMQNNYLPRVD